MAEHKIFAWPVDAAGVSATVDYNVRAIRFGDGYEQRQATGLRRKTQEWAVSKSGRRKRLEEIEAFLDAHMGLTPFIWRRRGAPDLLVKVESYTKTPRGGLMWTLSFTLKEVLA